MRQSILKQKVNSFFAFSLILLAACFAGGVAVFGFMELDNNRLAHQNPKGKMLVLGERTYSEISLFHALNLTLSATPYHYDLTGGKWNYKISWQRPAGRTGSIYIDGNVFVSNASGTGEAYTGYTLNPDASYRVTFYSSSKGRGARIVSRFFKVLSAEKPKSAQVEDKPAASAANQPPTIASVEGPSFLSANQTGTWKVNAQDPEGANLSYNVDWGDGGGGSPFSRQNSFTHSYPKAGKYTIAFTVDDGAGLMVKGPVDVTISPAITVVSPNGGETLVMGQPFAIQWKAGHSSNSNSVGVALILEREDGSQVGWIQIGNGPEGSFSWNPNKVRSDMGQAFNTLVAPGKYKIRALDYNDPRGPEAAFDLSDETFTIAN